MIIASININLMGRYTILFSSMLIGKKDAVLLNYRSDFSDVLANRM